MSSFDKAVYDNTQFNPPLLNVSLSSADNDVVLDTAGTINGVQVVGIAYTSGVTPVGSLVSLSAFDGTSFRIDEAYDSSQIALILADNSSTLITVASGDTVQTVGSATYDVVDPNLRRLWCMGMA